MKNIYNISSLSGAALSVIPFYRLIKIIKEFRLFTQSVAAVILTVIKIILYFPTLYLTIKLVVDFYNEYVLYELNYEDSNNTIIVIVILFLLCITITVLDIIVGFLFKNRATDEKYTLQERFEFGKLTGVYFSTFPLYLPIKTLISMSDIENMNTPCTTLATSIPIMYLVQYFIPIFSIFIQPAYFIVAIILGVKLSEEKIFIDEVKVYDYDSFDSF